MKRVGGIYRHIAEPDNLRLAYLKAARSKRMRPEVIAYAAELDANLDSLRRQLAAGRVDVGDYRFFLVNDPKERLICASAFPERVLHHAVMNLCEAVFERYAISDSYACRPSKGLHRAVDRAQHFARRYRWYLKLDVRRYFDSIDHELAMGRLSRLFRERQLLELFASILDSYRCTPGCGLPIGNLISQHLANLYLGEFDHWVKETKGVRGYVRYMDDMVLWGESKAQLRALSAECADCLADRLRLRVKPPQLNRSSAGLPFLGYRVFPRRITLGPRSRRRFVNKLRAYERLWASGEWSEADLQRHAEPLLAFVRVADTLGFRSDVIDRYGVSF